MKKLLNISLFLCLLFVGKVFNLYAEDVKNTIPDSSETFISFSSDHPTEGIDRKVVCGIKCINLICPKPTGGYYNCGQQCECVEVEASN